MEWVFITGCFLILYPYVIYPLVLVVVTPLCRRHWKKLERRFSFSIIISAYNEEKIIKQKVENALLLDHPEGNLEIVVVSDGSTDSTVEIVSHIHDPRLVLKDYAERAGKTACLNKVIPETSGELLLFTDANSIFPIDLLTKLSKNFCDETVGLVTGWTKYQTAEALSETTSVYSQFEKAIKCSESQISSCVGADGAVFAMRKSLFKPLRNDDINDLILPLRVVENGFRAVMDPEVYCIEQSAGDAHKEFQRQVRITNRTIRAIFANCQLLNPLQFGTFSFFLLSHKLLRLLVPFFVLIAALAGLLLALHSTIFMAFTFAAIALVIAIILFGARSKTHRCFQGAVMFVIMLAAQLVGWWHVFLGRRSVMWTPRRQ
ncbi:MAG: hypothetical protein CVU57_12860 [Deltaproteobacteria bacterium HGW-Deltaproteobacteria-15]|jgi:cellulose synthase/poly-beta-1,6-N-acetylglucosamine synthase-like glycosyltransferase|nr:MAG: hypothetical protein CVU57_12860 [Deltaproteobacteria bacterium HGW-Deltaproteobacteria-15]